MKKIVPLIYLLGFFLPSSYAQPVAGSSKSSRFFHSTFDTKGRGLCSISNAVLTTKDAWAEFGDASWSDYEIRFQARTPAAEKEVQIWSGFRAFNRNDRYQLGLRGGRQNSLYLARMGYMGADEFLALRMLEFKPVPGEWYYFRIVVKENRIRVYLNNEPLPRIDIRDSHADLAPSGKVTLGGGWVKTEYKELSIAKAPEEPVASVKEFASVLVRGDKEQKRMAEREAYRPVQVRHIAEGRTELSLNGRWLFMPGYEMNEQDKAVSPTAGDQQWHVMTVPNFWNPIRIWLHGERFGTHPKGVSDAYYQMETDRCEGYTFDYKNTGFAWYRQWIELPENITGKSTELVFDAISKVAEVWINGKKAGEHVGMFGELRIEGKDLFKPGRNLVTVKVIRDYVKDIKDAGKVVDVAVSVEITNRMLKDLAHGFYGDDPAGIWQPVSLIITNPLKVQDVYIKPGLTGAQFEITVKNNSDTAKTFSLVTDITDKETKARLYSGPALPNTVIHAGEEKVFTYAINDIAPRLWSPQSPNLYDFTFRLVDGNKEADVKIITSGFRTFESKDGFLWLNGKRYWLRGGNHTPFALAPNNRELADSFFQLMRRGNIEITRTHTSPWNELWMDAADRNGIGVSFEGTWSWLMLGESMPDKKLIDLWADEFIAVIKKYRNHPSLLIWTVNNEMKFYDNDPDTERAKRKMKIISDVVKLMRKTDPTRPIVFDSNYKRKTKRFGEAFYKDIDDGDIDDIHAYINWYNHSLFNQFRGEFQKENKNEGRPLISQEMSTGYPNNETGHGTRFYTLVHQNPSSLVGNLAYENADPANFLEAQSFITGELAEALRRSNEDAAGIIHFALLTWFRNVYDPKNIEPYPTYYAVKRALKPVLVSAELWGRHFYAGSQLPARICIVNDREEGNELPPSKLTWKLVTSEGSVIASGSAGVSAVKHYGRHWIDLEIPVPTRLPADKVNATLVLDLKINNQIVSGNEYKVLLAKKEWSRLPVTAGGRIVLTDFNNSKPLFDLLSIKTTAATSVSDAVTMPAELYVFSGLDTASNCSHQEAQQIRKLVTKGKKVLLLSSQSAATLIYPEYITGWLTDTEGDIANMEIPESPVFEDVGALELRYFNNNKDGLPAVCNVSLKINRHNKVEALASHTRIHGYINGDMQQRMKYMETIKGFPIVKINDDGVLLVSTMLTGKGDTDPVAGRLLVNMVASLLAETGKAARF